MKLPVRLLLIAIVGIFLWPRAAAAEDARYFPATGHYVRGDFLAFFDANGGLGTFGQPRAEAFDENGRTVQYFQRARLEWWPENAPGTQVQLGLLGAELGKT